MAFRARTFKITFRCYVDPEVYNGFNIAICVAGKLPTNNPIQQLYIKPAYNEAGWYEYIFYDFFLDDSKSYDVFVQAISYNTDSYWRSIGGIEVPDDGVGTIGDNTPTTSPNNVTGFNYQIIETGVILSWTPSYDPYLSHYEIKLGSTWETAGDPIYTGKSTSYPFPMTTSGTYTVLIKSVSVAGVECALASSISFTIVKPLAPSVSANVVGENILVTWTAPNSTFPIVEYELKKNGTSLGRFKTTTHTIKAPIAGTYHFTVEAINAVGEVGNTGSAEVTIEAPGAVVVYPQVIDNNVLLRWSAPTTGTLPIKEYEIRKGDVFSSATSIGKIKSLFTVLFESQAGEYKYWIAPFDTSDNDGPEAYCIANVSQPPDYILHSDRDSDFLGDKTNCLTVDDVMVAPVNTTHTWTEHFTSQGRTTPQAQIDAGFVYYLEPSLTSATYSEVIDYESIITSSKINVTVESRQLHGSVAVACQIETSDDEVNWTDHGSLYEVYAKDFQFVRFTLTFSASSSGTNLIAVDNINIKLSVKKKSDSGNIACLSTDSGGTVVTFNESFLDVDSITVTAKYDGTVAYALYDFVDAPNPTSFKILLYDRNGNRVSGTASWEAKGV